MTRSGVPRALPTLVGEFRATARGNYVLPYDDEFRARIEIPTGRERPPHAATKDRVGAHPLVIKDPSELDGMVVAVELLRLPEPGRGALGRVLEVLGYPDEFGVDVEIVIRKHRLPHRFPADVLEQAAAFSAVLRPADLKGRTDFRGLDVVTIDGETARDFDDAVWVDRTPGGNFLLHVHIADVSHYVAPGTPIDREARLRGTSVYFPDRAIPMLPLELSTELCSLKPRADRLVVSALLELDHRGDVLSQEFVRGAIRSVERMTYTDVHKVLEGDRPVRERYAHLAARFALMRELALILNRKRRRRGSIDFDLPEPLIEFDEWGEMTGITRAPRNLAHRIIEEFMLAANEAVAAHLEQAGTPAIYRIHEPPEPQRVLEFEEVAAHFGHSLGIGPIPVQRFPVVDRKRDGAKLRKDVVLADSGLRVTPRHYQKLIDKIEGRPEERILNYLMLRSLMQARYRAENTGHFALASRAYTHFTSPIRRYPDLMVHRALLGEPHGLPLEAVAEECSLTERRAADAERELVEWKKVKFMSERLGDEFSALIVSTHRFGFFVELEDLFVEGLVPIDTLPGDRYGYQENTRRIVGQRTRRTFAIGDALTVRLDRADTVERKLQFSVVGQASACPPHLG